MSPTPPARVTVFYQPTLLHIRVSITQLGAHVPSALLSKPNACVAIVGNWHTQGTFLVIWRVSSASQIILSLLEHAGPVRRGGGGGGGGGVSGVPQPPRYNRGPGGPKLYCIMTKEWYAV